MTLIEKELIKEEGLKLKPYLDTVGKTTIGVGRNLDDNGISEDEALYMLRNDILRCQIELEREVLAFMVLNEARRYVLISMCFNMGIGRLLGFTKMLFALEEKDYVTTSQEMLNSLWAKQVPTRALKLAQIMITGEIEE